MRTRVRNTDNAFHRSYIIAANLSHLPSYQSGRTHLPTPDLRTQVRLL